MIVYNSPSMLRPLALLAVLALPSAARASGFLLYEQSAPAMARGSAVVAATHDPSAAWFNPAAVTELPGWGVSLSTSLVWPQTRFSPAAGGDDTRARSRLSLVPGIFAHGRLTDRLNLSLAVLAPFGLYIKWPDGWPGAEQSLLTDLKVLAVNPSLAVRLSDRWSVAGGVSPIRGLVKLAIALPPPNDGGRADLDGGAWGVQFNAAVLWKALPQRLHFGASYRSRTKLDFKGTADFSGVAPGLQETLPDQGVKATITLPDVFAGGVMWRPLPRLELDAELDWVLWSTFKELFIDFENPGTPFDRSIKRSAVKPLTGRLGGQWDWPALGLCARAGISYDQSASRKDTLAPSAPDANRLGLATGLGYQRGRFTVDLAYLFALLLPAESAGPNARPEGTYRTHAHVLSVMLGAWTQ
jgi:long-chain fatty acid transport protein